MAAQASPSSGSAIRRGSEANQADAFAPAERHSRRVRVLKIAFPVAAVALAIGFATFSYLQSPAEVAVDTTESAFVDGKLVMAMPQLEGLTKDNRPYEMLAQRAIQELNKPGVIKLDAISAKLPLFEKDWVTIDAPEGTYDRDNNTLDMKDPFRINASNGLSATINSAFIDMGNSTMKTDKPVDITMNGTRITADSMSVLEKGKLFVFDKRVRLVIEPARLKEMRSAKGAEEGVTADADGG